MEIIEFCPLCGEPLDEQNRLEGSNVHLDCHRLAESSENNIAYIRAWPDRFLAFLREQRDEDYIQELFGLFREYEGSDYSDWVLS